MLLVGCYFGWWVVSFLVFICVLLLLGCLGFGFGLWLGLMLGVG